MLVRSLLILINSVLVGNLNTLNASDKINKINIDYNFHKSLDNNYECNKEYWDEFSQTIKCTAREILKERFYYCSDWLLKLLKSKELLIKINSINRYKYKYNNINDVINVSKFKEEINIRRELLDNISNKYKLNGNAWSEIPMIINGYNSEHQNQIGQYINWYCELLQNHWGMKFNNNYGNVKLSFYAAYEYQNPQFFYENINSEQTLSICMSSIEMDLLTSNKATNNIELFANYLISKKDKFAKQEITRYRKYLNDEQNDLLARHIIHYYLSFPKHKKINIAKYLTTDYVLIDLFNNIKANKFLQIINDYRTDNWFNIIIYKYLENEFGTKYNKSYLESFKKIILEDQEYFKGILLPKLREYSGSIFAKLVEVNSKIINNNKEYLKTRKDKLFIPKNKKDYKNCIKILNVLNGATAGYQSGSKVINCIIKYLNLDTKYKFSKIKKLKMHS